MLELGHLESERNVKDSKMSGVYFVIIPPIFNLESFIYPGTGDIIGGILIYRLRIWIRVKGADILYIGRAGVLANGKPYTTDLKLGLICLILEI